MNTPYESPEFSLIRAYFSHLTHPRQDVILGIGDDAALMRLPPGMIMATSIDTMVSGIHFLADVAPDALGYKALAVNLSDLAAMGAEPAWATLALTLPKVDSEWLKGFCQGFAQLAGQYRVQLVGGDTTRGPLSVTIQVQGFLPKGRGLRRDGAKVGDDICVTGTLGDAALSLRQLLNDQLEDKNTKSLRQRLERPQPRVDIGIALRDIAHSAIDISDGLVADLSHILTASGVGASLELAHIPCSPSVRAFVQAHQDWTLVATGGDDYELCITLPSEKRSELAEIAKQHALSITRIGKIEQQPGLRCYDDQEQLWSPKHLGYDHFTNHDA
jgi:thiamine-monophosphate kinase